MNRSAFLCTLLLLLFILFFIPAGTAAPEVVLPPDADWLATGEQQGAEFSYVVAGVGDLDGNGYDEIAVGSPRHQDTVYREGAVMIYQGGPSGPADVPRWTLASGQTGARFGAALAGVGDVNGDGFADLLVGAPEYNNGTTRTGAVFLYYGSAQGPSLGPDWSMVSAEQGANLGIAVAGGGDVNGDGYADLLAGARRASNQVESEGAAFLYLGGPAGPAATPDWTAWGGQKGAALGESVALAGDLNGDGYADLAVGAPHLANGEEDEGAVLVFYGAANLPLVAGPVLEANCTGAGFGAALAAAGDVNGDGYGDLLVGAPSFNAGQVAEGAAFLYAGSAGGLLTAAAWQVTGDQEWAYLGISVAGAGDVNGDGYADVLVGAHLMDLDQPDEGVAFLYPGGATGLRPHAAWLASGEKADANLGFSVAGAGDANRDGYADLLAGAPLFRVDRLIVGRSLYFGGAPGEFPELISYDIYLPLVQGSD